MEKSAVPDTPKDVEDLPPRSQIPSHQGASNASRWDRLFVSGLLLVITAFLLYLIGTVFAQHVI